MIKMPVAALLLALATPTRAAPEARGQAAPAPAASPTVKAAGAAVKPQALEVARLVVPQEEWSRAMELLAQDAVGRMQGHPGSRLELPPDFASRVRGEVEQVLPYGELLGMHAAELSARYTEQELSELLAFYRTLVGQKALKVMPAVSEQVGEQSQRRFEKAMPEVMQRLAQSLKKPAQAKEKPAARPGK
ncbi:MAG TPA: DUF2059 domain-containing protein [Anaeromyxobacter sp.]